MTLLRRDPYWPRVPTRMPILDNTVWIRKVEKVLSPPAHGETGPERHGRRMAALIRADVSNGTEKPVKRLAGRYAAELMGSFKLC